MCPKLFSSLILRELIEETEHTDERLLRGFEAWAETMMMKYSQELQEHPVVYLTEPENFQARKYLTSYRKYNIDIAERAVGLMRGKHAAEIREFLKSRHDGWPLFAKHESVEEEHESVEEKHESEKEKHDSGEEKHENVEEKHESGEEKHESGEEKHKSGEEVHENVKEKHKSGEEQHEGVKEKQENVEEKHESVEEKHESVEEDHFTFPKDDRAPASFKEWFAVTSVWRLTRAMPEIPYSFATIGGAESVIRTLPNAWEEKLEECLKVTEASAIVPVPRGWDLPLRRRDIDSILPTKTLDAHESGLLSNGIISSWFQILLAHHEKTIPGCTIFVPPDSLDLAGSTPREVAEKRRMVNAKIDTVFFPTVIKERDHCLLVVAYPKTKVLIVLNPLGSDSTRELQTERPWIKVEDKPKGGDWEVIWVECPHPRAEVACGVFMLVNALVLLMVKNPAKAYTHQDATFLRRYVAAVICMGKLPEKL